MICGVVVVAFGFDGLSTPFLHWTMGKPDFHSCETGAWGRLWYETSVIEIPPDRIQVEGIKPEPVKWYFAASSSAELVATLQACDLDASQIRDLVATLSPAVDGGGIILHPPEEFILSLSDSVRRKLYGFLGQNARNNAYVWPFRFCGTGKADWFEGANVDPKVVELVRSLIYHQGESQMFSDMDIVLKHYPSAAVYSNLFHVLSRESTLVARVRVMPEDDVDALARYWGVPNRQDDVRTLMKTLQGTENCRDVPVSMLLPGFAKNRIYRYWHQGDPDFASCHYTSMNFLNQHADAKYTNLTVVAKTLASDYVEVNRDFRLGDIVLLMKNENEAIHSCNYVAEGIVFTRNGGSFAQPWMLTKLEAVVDFYSYPDPVHVKVMRRRDLISL